MNENTPSSVQWNDNPNGTVTFATDVVAKMANLDVIQTIGVHMNYTLVCGAISTIGVTIMCILLGDYKPGPRSRALPA